MPTVNGFASRIFQKNSDGNLASSPQVKSALGILAKGAARSHTQCLKKELTDILVGFEAEGFNVVGLAEAVRAQMENSAAKKARAIPRVGNKGTDPKPYLSFDPVVIKELFAGLKDSGYAGSPPPGPSRDAYVAADEPGPSQPSSTRPHESTPRAAPRPAEPTAPRSSQPSAGAAGSRWAPPPPPANTPRHNAAPPPQAQAQAEPPPHHAAPPPQAEPPEAAAPAAGPAEPPDVPAPPAQPNPLHAALSLDTMSDANRLAALESSAGTVNNYTQHVLALLEAEEAGAEEAGAAAPGHLTHAQEVALAAIFGRPTGLAELLSEDTYNMLTQISTLENVPRGVRQFVGLVEQFRQVKQGQVRALAFSLDPGVGSAQRLPWLRLCGHAELDRMEVEFSSHLTEFMLPVVSSKAQLAEYTSTFLQGILGQPINLSQLTSPGLRKAMRSVALATHSDKGGATMAAAYRVAMMIQTLAKRAVKESELNYPALHQALRLGHMGEGARAQALDDCELAICDALKTYAPCLQHEPNKQRGALTRDQQVALSAIFGRRMRLNDLLDTSVRIMLREATELDSLSSAAQQLLEALSDFRRVEWAARAEAPTI